MDPQQQNHRDPRLLRIPQRRFVAPQKSPHEAAAHIVRQQINQIYDTAPPNQPKEVEEVAPQAVTTVAPLPVKAADVQPIATQPEQQEVLTAQENPYQRTAGTEFDWREYHTAWQNYYQKYYERYYWQQLHAERQKLAATAADRAVAKEEGVTVGADPNAPAKNKVDAFKKDITNKVKERANKVRKSHHFVPLISAVGVGLIFIFFAV